jgi:hypothetical protein
MAKWGRRVKGRNYRPNVVPAALNHLGPRLVGAKVTVSYSASQAVDGFPKLHQRQIKLS